MISCYDNNASQASQQRNNHRQTEKLAPKSFEDRLMHQVSNMILTQSTVDDQFNLNVSDSSYPESRNIANICHKEVTTSKKRTISHSLLEMITDDHFKSIYPKIKHRKTELGRNAMIDFDPNPIQELFQTAINKEKEEDWIYRATDDNNDDCTSIVTFESNWYESVWTDDEHITDEIRQNIRFPSWMSDSKDYSPEDYAQDFEMYPALEEENCFLTSYENLQTSNLIREHKTCKPGRPTNFLLSLLNRILEQPDASSSSITGESLHQSFDERLDRIFMMEIEPRRHEERVLFSDEMSVNVQNGFEQDELGLPQQDTLKVQEIDSLKNPGINEVNEWKGFDADIDSLTQSVHDIANKLDEAMRRSNQSISLLQEWDKKNGLPKSHSQTMVNSSRSREQLLTGMVLQKWNG
jgi:hypothetical protein